MKILLVNTNRMKPAIAPIGLDYLADCIISAGNQPLLLDLCFSDDVAGDIRSAVREFAPDVVGLSVRNTDDCYFSGGEFFLPGVREMIEVFRQSTDAPIVMGGVGFSVMPEAAMEFCGADFGIAGEGEEAFIQLLAAIERGSGYERVPNLLYRADGTIHRNKTSFTRLDALPPRKRSFPDNPRYFNEGGQAGIETKRGCNMGCTYCADPVSKGRTVRLRLPEQVVEEIQSLLNQGVDHFHTCDCEFNIPGEHAKEVCRAIIDAGLGDKIRWYAYCSITPFDSEMAVLFKKAGCAGVDFGADSGSDKMLRSLNRHFRAVDLVSTAKLCHQHDIPFMYDLLLGAPGETRESVRESIELMQRIEADCVGLSMGVRIYESTEIAKYVRAQGDAACNPHVYGAKVDNPFFMRPVFYIAPELGLGIVDYVRELVGDDTRFFLPIAEAEDSNYNYNGNDVLVNAIRDGARGAYWDILRRLQH